jgi:hypothetical protein
MKDKELIEFFKKGDFTIISWDSGCFSVYPGKTSVNKIKDDIVPIHEFDYSDRDGYMLDIVKIMAKSLNGHSDTI